MGSQLIKKGMSDDGWWWEWWWRWWRWWRWWWWRWWWWVAIGKGKIAKPMSQNYWGGGKGIRHSSCLESLRGELELMMIVPWLQTITFIVQRSAATNTIPFHQNNSTNFLSMQCNLTQRMLGTHNHLVNAAFHSDNIMQFKTWHCRA